MHLSESPTVIEVFADLVCPFTHLGLRRFVERRGDLGRDDVRLWVRAWPLELVNGEPVAPGFVAEEIAELRAQVAPDRFAGFREAAFPSSSLPGLTLAAAAYRVDLATGERVSLELRDLFFEQGVDISDPEVLARVAVEHGVHVGDQDHEAVLADHAEGRECGVIGSPHFFTPGGGFFCPSLRISRDDTGHLRVRADVEAFDQFVATCFR